MTIGRSWEGCRILVAWMRLRWPKPIGPRSTVAPARCTSRAWAVLARGRDFELSPNPLDAEADVPGRVVNIVLTRATRLGFCIMT